jgi:N6-adenosine-specific RNA methylase IME4
MTGKYKTVVIDPPWPIDNIGIVPHMLSTARQDRRPFARKVTFPEDQSTPYSKMSLGDIAAFPIDDFAANQALLFLWVTNSRAEKRPVLQIGFELLEKWGFTYHQMITWAKSQGFAMWSPILRRTEHCLFADRGKLAELTNHQNGVMPSYIFTDGQSKHSEKPVQFYQMLRRWTPEPRIDLFARRTHEGFDGWGNEYAGDQGPLLEFLR